MRKIYCILFFIIAIGVNAQIEKKGVNNFYCTDKEYNHETAEVKAKYFLVSNVLDKSSWAKTIEISPIASGIETEWTLLYYTAPDEKKEGIVLAFTRNFWSDSGIKFLEYGFKNLSKEDAFALLDRISAQIDKKAKFTLKKTESNIYFSYQDIDVVITNVGGSYLIKLFWNGFESTWSGKSFENARKKIDKIISKR